MPTEIEVGLNMAIIVPSQYLGNVRIVDIEKTHTLIVWYRAGFERILPPKGHCCDETCLLRSRSSVLPEGRGSPSASPNRIANTGPHAKRLDHEWPHHGLHIASRQAGEIQSPTTCASRCGSSARFGRSSYCWPYSTWGSPRSIATGRSARPTTRPFKSSGRSLAWSRSCWEERACSCSREDSST